MLCWLFVSNLYFFTAEVDLESDDDLPARGQRRSGSESVSAPPPVSKTDGDDSDDSYWQSDSDSDSDSSEDDAQYTSIRERFLKK